MESAQVSYKRLLEAALAHKNAADEPDDAIAPALDDFFGAISDDLNAPKALGFMWVLAKNPHKSKRIYDALVSMDSILALDIAKCQEKLDTPQELPIEVEELVAKRSAARAARDWAESDRLRDLIAEMGYNVLDSKDGTKVTKK
jgi:cysteinyl-tRNA synthetase